ncbi:MAG: hypothetical protein J6V93_02405 [Clostridia bacterium]|nr:hypothetical protein [Clostridia bacterium]
MLLDYSGIILNQGYGGKNCRGNGEHYNDDGMLIDCCCDECDYLMCCLKIQGYGDCKRCKDTVCPSSPEYKE